MTIAINNLRRAVVAAAALSLTVCPAGARLAPIVTGANDTSTNGQSRSVFDGRWRPDGLSMKTSAKPTVILLRDGMFQKGEGAAGDIIPADGRLHPVDDNDYIDQVSITVLADGSVREVDMLRGKVVYSVDYTASSDGKTAFWQVTNQANPNGSVARSETRQRRI